METLFGAERRAPRILLIEDSGFQRRWLRQQLEAERIEVLEAEDGLAGLEICQSNPPELILLDLYLPYCDGFEILRRLKAEHQTSSIPVIVVSGANARNDKIRGLDLGAVDWVTKPFDVFELKARIRVALRTKWMQDMLETRAHIDGLTGLPNRFALEHRFATEWANHQRLGSALAVWVADLDHFKVINDTYGHLVGDEILRHTSELLRSSVRSTDVAARFGGEEFIVIAPHCDASGAFKTAERFRDVLAASPIQIESEAIHVTVSIGVASWPENLTVSAPDLLAAADRAFYRAKSAGRNAVRCWSSGGNTPKLCAVDS